MPTALPGRHRSRLVVVLSYAVVGIAWIAFSDRVIEGVVPPGLLPLVATLKGAGFVALTAALLWLMLVIRDRRIEHGQATVARSEARYRMLAERMQDVVYRYRLLPTPAFEYVSPSVTAMTGYTPEDHYADPQLGTRLVVEEDLGKLAAYQGTAMDEPLVIRWRSRDGGLLITEHRITAVRNDAGEVVAIEGVARDVTDRVAADEHRHLLTRAIEETPVGVGVVSGRDGAFEFNYVNPAMARLVGMPAAKLVGSPALDLAGAGGPLITGEVVRGLAGGQTQEIEADLAPDGRAVPVSVLVAPVRAATGELAGMVAFITDRTEAKARDRAEARLGLVVDASPTAIVSADGQGITTAWNPAAERMFGWTAAEMLGRRLSLVPEESRAEFDDLRRRMIAGEPFSTIRLPLLRRDGSRVASRITVGMIRPTTSTEPPGMVALIEDLSEQVAHEESLAQLSGAIDSAAEAIVITDLAGAMTYVNPAFEEVTGYRRDELIGRNPNLLKSGLTPTPVYEDMWRRLTVGETWRGILVNRRKDGSLFEEDATLSPVRGADGATTAYVGVKRDLTLESRLATGLSIELNDRAAVQEAMARIEPGSTPEETAHAVCEALAALRDVDEAILEHLPPGAGPVIPLAMAGSDMLAVHVGEPLDASVSSFVREQAAAGPWAGNHLAAVVDVRIDRPELAGYATVAAPVVFHGRPVAVLFAASRTVTVDSWIARYLRVVAELATYAAPLLGPQLEARDAISGSRDQVRRIIDGREFAQLFQPVCDLTTRRPAGWEALTRFDDAVPPSRRFADAHLLGMGEELEIACGRQAIEAFGRQEHPGWLSVNVSPALVLSGLAARLLRDAGRPIVLELTEHVPIDDYARLRGALDLLEPPAMIAIDDRGGGYASLRHVLELRPDFVKLDRGFVHAIDGDPARQAMIAGMVHYAAETGTRLIAEGVETEAERRALLRLGVRYGQGYLLGVPTAGGAVEPSRGAPREPARRLRAVGEDEDTRSAAG